MNVDRGVFVSQMNGMAVGAFPNSFLERQIRLDEEAVVALFAGGIEPINDLHRGSCLRAHIVQCFHKITESQITDLFTPKPLHRIEVEVFKAQNVVGCSQPQSQLEMIVLASVGNPFVHSRQVQPCLLTMMGTSLLARKIFVGLGEFLLGLLEEQRRFYRGSIVESEKGFQTKIKARAFTRHDSGGLNFRHVATEEQKEVA